MRRRLKPYVRATPEDYLELLEAADGNARLDDLAEAAGQHIHTARAHLDGLVAQGKLRATDGPIRDREYELVRPVAADAAEPVIVATQEDLREFGSLWGDLAQEAAVLSARLPEDHREGAETVRRVAQKFVAMVAAGDLHPDTRPSALPLSRPFGEWHGVDDDTRATWDAIGRIETFWDDRLGKGVFSMTSTPPPIRPPYDDAR